MLRTEGSERGEAERGISATRKKKDGKSGEKEFGYGQRKDTLNA